VLIDHLRGARAFAAPAGTVSYSVVTRAELFAGKASQEAVVEQLLAPMRELALDRSIAERAGRLRRDHGVALADALIAATALAHGLDLLTRNRRHFVRVPGLRIAAALS
jgi:predicted nucleic acid-binding protein